MKNLLYFFIIFLLSCGGDNSKNEIKKEREIEEQRKIELERKVNELSNNLNILYNWDTIDFTYSIDYIEVLQSESQILKEFDLLDLYQKNGQLFASIEVSYIKIDLEINELQLQSLIESEGQNEKGSLALLVNISEIKKLDEQCCESYLDFFGKGSLIEIINLDSI